MYHQILTFSNQILAVFGKVTKKINIDVKTNIFLLQARQNRKKTVKSERFKKFINLQFKLKIEIDKFGNREWLQKQYVSGKRKFYS